MRTIIKALAVLIGFSGIFPAAATEAVIGSVVRSEGPCVGVSDGQSESLTGGMAVRLMEKVTTGAAGRLEIAFRDGTHLTVGEKAEIVLDDFVYEPKGGNRFHAVITGPFRYLSGKLAAGATRQASVTTPFADIGVRGTDFWGGTLNGVTGVVVFEGEVLVTTAAGSVVLRAPGQGTNLSARDAPPTAVTQWSDERIATAIASVAFH